MQSRFADGGALALATDDVMRCAWIARKARGHGSVPRSSPPVLARSPETATTDLTRPSPHSPEVQIMDRGRQRSCPWTMQNSRPTGRPLRSRSHGVRCEHARWVYPYLSPRVALPVTNEQSASLGVAVGFVERECLADPQRRPLQHEITSRSPTPSGQSPARASPRRSPRPSVGQADTAALFARCHPSLERRCRRR